MMKGQYFNQMTNYKGKGGAKITKQTSRISAEIATSTNLDTIFLPQLVAAVVYGNILGQHIDMRPPVGGEEQPLGKGKPPHIKPPPLGSLLEFIHLQAIWPPVNHYYSGRGDK